MVELVRAALVEKDRRRLAVELFETAHDEPPDEEVVEVVNAQCRSTGVALLDGVAVD